MLQRAQTALCVAACVLAGVGCDLLDPARPTVQPDMEIFGNLLDSEAVADEPGVATVRVRIAPPRVLRDAEGAEGRPTPAAEEGLTAKLRVDFDTVVLLGGMPADLGDIASGTEVVGIPSPGTTRMVGEDEILLNAQMLMDFETYRRWRLPRLQAVPAAAVDSVELVNTDGVEHAAVPVAGGRVLYFSARLRRGDVDPATWVGAGRQGLVATADGKATTERSYRTVLGEDGWSEPELVVFPGLEDPQLVRVSWVNGDETRCLVTVGQGPDASPWVGVSERPSAAAGWGEVAAVEHLGTGDAFDAVYLAGSKTKIVFVSSRQGANQTDLFLLNPAEQAEALPLEPRINTIGSEWGPRVGPDNELYFTRGDRQLMFAGGMVQPVYLGLPHRVLFVEMAPTDDGRWVFLTYTRLRPNDSDLDIWVAPRLEDGTLGAPVPVDGWRPGPV
jgi:hypothetical protein